MILDLDLTEYNVITNDSGKNDEPMKNKYSKEFKVDKIPGNFMIDGPVVNDICAFIRDVSSTEPTQGYVHALLYADFVDIHSNEMKRKLSPIKPKSNKNTYKKDNRFGLKI